MTIKEILMDFNDYLNRPNPNGETHLVDYDLYVEKIEEVLRIKKSDI